MFPLNTEENNSVRSQNGMTHLKEKLSVGVRLKVTVVNNPRFLGYKLITGWYQAEVVI